MNERIKELAEQAGARTRDICSINSGYHIEFQLINADIEKFAELIVRECVTVLERLQDDTDRQNWPTPYGCAEAIREHFGLEGEK